MYLIRKMLRQDVDFAIDLAAEEGWNPGISDAGSFYSADPDGFFISELDGEPIGCISAVSYGGSYGFIGLYIVKPEYRGRGYGIKLWDAAMGYLGDRNIGLDGVIAQQEDYKKSGFKLAYRNIRYTGTAPGSKAAERVTDLNDVPFEDLVEYDGNIFSVRRPGFLKGWVARPGGAAVAVLEEGRLAGYGVIRECRAGYKIGPIFADDGTIAEDLFNALSSKAHGKPVFLDVPEINKDAVRLAEKYGMQPVFETARMYTKPVDTSPVRKVFGVTTFELG